jgi:hypothetical protein
MKQGNYLKIEFLVSEAVSSFEIYRQLSAMIMENTLVPIRFV